VYWHNKNEKLSNRRDSAGRRLLHIYALIVITLILYQSKTVSDFLLENPRSYLAPFARYRAVLFNYRSLQQRICQKPLIWEYCWMSYIAKNYSLDYIFIADNIGLFSTTFVRGWTHKLVATKFGLNKLETSFYRTWCKMCFDILKRLGVDHECDRRTDRTADSNSTV